MTSPPLISFLAALGTPLRTRRLVIWSMDLNPDEAIAAGWLKEKSLITRALSWMTLYSFRRADRIIALDRFMAQRIQNKGLSRTKITVLPPWSHDDYVHFNQAGCESFRSTHNLAGKFVVMYSGNHSPCHPLETLLNAAERLLIRSDIVFCFVGGGSEFKKVIARAKDRGLANVLCLPYEPIENLSASLSAADLHVVVMGDEFVGLVHPCKIYNILAIGKNFLYIGPQESHLSDIINQIENPDPSACSATHGNVADVVANILRAMDKGLSGSSLSSLELHNRFAKESLMPDMLSIIEEWGGPEVGTQALSSMEHGSD